MILFAPMIQKTFRNINELITRLYQDRRLISEMFQHRRSIDFSRDDALALTDESRLAVLTGFGVLREEGNLLEIEESYLQFFEEVLLANEEITGSAIADQLELLKENIKFYLMERENPLRQIKYIRKVKRSLRSIAQLSARNLIDLKRNVDDTFKNEPNYNIKREKLQKYLKNIDEINRLINSTQELLDNENATFEHFAPDEELTALIISVRIELNEVSHAIIEQQSVIRDYLHRIDRQDRMVKKLRRLKMLKDQFLWKSATDLYTVLDGKTDLFLDPLPPVALRPSLSFLRQTDAGSEILDDARKSIAKTIRTHTKGPGLLTEGDLNAEPVIERYVDPDALAEIFFASEKDLFSFVMEHEFEFPQSLEQRLVHYTVIAQRYVDRLEFTGEWRDFEMLSYPIILSAK